MSRQPIILAPMEMKYLCAQDFNDFKRQLLTIKTIEDTKKIIQSLEIIRKTIKNQENDSDDEYAPPTKRRKINNNKNKSKSHTKRQSNITITENTNQNESQNTSSIIQTRSQKHQNNM